MKPTESSNPPCITSSKNSNPHRAKETITAVFEFTQSGYLKRVFLNSQDESDQFILKKGIQRLIKPLHFGWIGKLFS